MKKRRIAMILLLAMALIVTGCSKEVSPKEKEKQSASDKTKESADYATKLFGKAVITVKIKADKAEWKNLMENAEAKNYIKADVTIGNMTYKDVGIKTKGNTSLTQVAATDSDRFSLKLNFDKYVEDQNCYGLDKLVLNNVFGDTTYLKEYMSYDLFDYLEVPSSLHTFADIYVNDEHYGFYLALEDVDDSFLTRNYGEDYTGAAYKPESFEMNADAKKAGGGNLPQGNNGGYFGGENQPQGNDGGNPGGGKDGQNMDIAKLFTLTDKSGKETDWNKIIPDNFKTDSISQIIYKDGTAADFNFRDLMNIDLTKIAAFKDENGAKADVSGYTLAVSFKKPQNTSGKQGQNDDNQNQGVPDNKGAGGAGGQNGGSLGVNLVYNGDELSNYSNIFDNAITKTKETDNKRLIATLKAISEGKDLEKYIDVDEVLRYTAVNVFLVNLDSYFSNMGHNYVLYEDKGKLSMLPWDYNLSFGTFNKSGNSDAVNYAIDTVFDNVTAEERPVIGLLLKNDEYKEKYHKYLSQLVEYVTSGKFDEKADSLSKTIDSYVKDDTTSFEGYDAFKEGISVLREFTKLRAKSVSGQLDGSIPSTTEAQSGSTALVDSSGIDLSKLGGMENNKGQNGFGGEPGMNSNAPNESSSSKPQKDNGEAASKGK